MRVARMAHDRVVRAQHWRHSDACGNVTIFALHVRRVQLCHGVGAQLHPSHLGLEFGFERALIAVCVFVLQDVSNIQLFICCHYQLHIVIQNQLFLFMFTRLMSLGQCRSKAVC